MKRLQELAGCMTKDLNFWRYYLTWDPARSEDAAYFMNGFKEKQKNFIFS
jgi:fibrillarin-like rRNA methylase